MPPETIEVPEVEDASGTAARARSTGGVMVKPVANARMVSPVQSATAKVASGLTRPPSKKSATTTAVAAAKKVSTNNPLAAAKAVKQEPAKAIAAIDLAKASSPVLASLKKTTSKPVKQRALMAAIKSLLGPAGDSQTVHAVLARLLAAGKVVIDGKGSVQYTI